MDVSRVYALGLSVWPLEEILGFSARFSLLSVPSHSSRLVVPSSFVCPFSHSSILFTFLALLEQPQLLFVVFASGRVSVDYLLRFEYNSSFLNPFFFF